MVDGPTVVDHDFDGLFVREVSSTARDAAGHPLVFVHGGYHGWWAWESWQSYFAGLGWRTYALSLPGHTGSKPLPDAEFAALDLSDYARAVRAVLGRLDGPPVLVGHSMGGIVAQKVAQCVDLAALVLVASGRTREGDPFWPELPPGRPHVLGKEDARKFFHLIDEEEFDHIFQLMCPESPAALYDLPRGGVVDAPRFECPVLVLSAERDRPHVGELADRATRAYHATRAVVLNAGHDLMLDPTSNSAATYLQAWLVTHVPSALPAVQVTGTARFAE